MLNKETFMLHPKLYQMGKIAKKKKKKKFILNCLIQVDLQPKRVITIKYRQMLNKLNQYHVQSIHHLLYQVRLARINFISIIIYNLYLQTQLQNQFMPHPQCIQPSIIILAAANLSQFQT